MKIVGVFNSWQGEGCNMGVPCTFIRTYGCNLQCDFCDEKEHRDAGMIKEYTVGELVERCMHKLVVVTGGEPTLQAVELKLLVKKLQENDHIVAIESNGTFPDYSEFGCYVAVSPKRENMYAFVPSGVAELKYVVTEEFNADVAIPESVRTKFARRIWLQPCDYGEGEKEKNKRMLSKINGIIMKDDRLRAGIQLHKIYGVL